MSTPRKSSTGESTSRGPDTHQTLVTIRLLIVWLFAALSFSCSRDEARIDLRRRRGGVYAG